MAVQLRHPALWPLASALIRALPTEDLPEAPDAISAFTALLASLDWLAPELRVPNPDRYRREALFQTADGSLSIGCFVWGPGQKTPIHDHRGWGLIGVAVGSLEETGFVRTDSGALRTGATRILEQGQIGWCRAGDGGIHRVGSVGRSTAISIHAYGAAFDQVCGTSFDLPEESL